MAIISPGSSRNCITCQAFDGERKTDPFKRNVICDAAVKGVCAASKRSVTMSTAACFRWKKWDNLK